ncbi:interferon-induced helicase C domain-containing protein 1 isoform 2-T2 [Mantella aurantiaca]
MAQEVNNEVISLNMIETFKSRLIRCIQVAPMLDYMTSLDATFKETLRNTDNTMAATMLIDTLVSGPHQPGWFEEFVNALAESENSQAHLYVAGVLPSSKEEAKQDDCEKLLRLLYPKLVSKMKPSELSFYCLKKNLCSFEDVENICRRTDNHSQMEGNRELLCRITKKKDWFRSFLAVLHEMNNKELILELTGVTYEEFIAGCNERSKLQDDATKCNGNPQDCEDVSNGNMDIENHDVTEDRRQHELAYSESSTQSAECNEACEPASGAERSEKNQQDVKVPSDVPDQETENPNVTADNSLLDSSLADSSAMSDPDVSLSELSLNKTSDSGEMSHDSDDESTDRASPGHELTLRSYQMEVAKPALEGENVIICLPTGSGKTRVAVYITRDHLEKRRAQDLPAKAIVLVNKVPLVEQHFQSEFHPYLKDSYVVTKISGDSQLKISFPNVVKKSDVIICTAQILENSLIQAAENKAEGVSLSDFSLLIIDECHHTIKDAVYNNIMLRYIKQKKRNARMCKTEDNTKIVPLPQVLGLTASPGVGGANQSKKAEEHILRVCANLDSRIMTVKENLHQLQTQVKLPYKQVDIAEDKKENPFGDKIKKMMVKIEEFGDLASTSEHGTQAYEQWVVQKEKSAAKEGNRTQHVCADHLKKYNDALQISDMIRMNDALINLEKFYNGEKEKILLLQENDTEGVTKKIDKTDKYLIDLFYREKEKLRSLADNEKYENEKLAKLRRAIMEEFSNNSKARGIVFTKTRQSAVALCQWISDNDKFKEEGIRAHFLIGAGANSDFTSMTQNEQKKVIHKFSTGELNLLIATSVAEEGLDIPECNIVIIYGRITNEIAMMQARGRARAEASKLVLVASNSSRAAEHDSVNEYREGMMYKAIKKVQEMSPEVFAEKIHELQCQNIVEKRVKKNKNMRKVYQQNPHRVTFLCRKCQKLVFSGGDICVIENMHHIITDPKFRKLFKKGENKTLQEKFADYQANGEIICKDCGRTWGTMMVHKGLDLPCLQIRNFVIKYKEEKMTNDTLEVWRDLPIKFPPFQYVEPEESDGDDYTH